MIIRRFLEWYTTSEVDERIEAAQAFCDAYMQRVPEIINHPDCEAVLTLILDDASLCVRRALAEALAGFELAPRHIIIGLANECSDIAIPVLGRSSLLSDADLIDCLAIGDDAAQSAICLRNTVSVSVSAAIAEIGCLNAVSLLVKNAGAMLVSSSLVRIAERFCDDHDIRHLLLDRNDLPVAVRYFLITSISQKLISFVDSCGWNEGARARRMISVANEKAIISLATTVERHHVFELAETLRDKSQLTPSLLLRSLLCGHLNLFEASLGILAQMSHERITTLLCQKSSINFTAIYRRAKMPQSMELAFKTAYFGAFDVHTATFEPKLSRKIVQQVLLNVSQSELAENVKMIGLLRRLDAEAAKEDARYASTQILLMPDPIDIIVNVENTNSPIDFSALEYELIEYTEGHVATQTSFDSKSVEAVDNEIDALDLSHFKRAA